MREGGEGVSEPERPRSDDELSPEAERQVERLSLAVVAVLFGSFLAIVVTATYVVVRLLLRLV